MTAPAPAPTVTPSSGTVRRQVTIVVILALVVSTLVLGRWFDRGFLIPDPTAWVEGRLLSASYDPPTRPVELFHNQGDGQLFAHMAQDPFLDRPHDITGGSAEQAYRLQRPLYGWAGWMLSLGDPGRVAWMMVWLTMLSTALLAGVTAMLAHRLGASPLAGALVLLAPGVHVDLLRCGPEVLGTALLGLGLLALRPGWERPFRIDLGAVSARRLALATGSFALAGLARESFLLVPLLISATWLWETRGRDFKVRAVGAVPLVSLLPLAMWILLLRIVVGAWPIGSEGEGRLSLVPFGGMMSAIDGWEIGEVLSLAGTLGLALVALVVTRSRLLRVLLIAHVALAATFGEVVWYTWVGFPRVLLPMSFLSLFALVEAQQHHHASDRPPALGKRGFLGPSPDPAVDLAGS